MKKNKTIKYIVHPEKSVFSELQIRENPDEAFENAIQRGMKNPDDWMYMYSENGRDYFKNYINRGYISYSQFGIIEEIKIILKKVLENIRKDDKNGTVI